jgi:AcrR family transcriptional regulator
LPRPRRVTDEALLEAARAAFVVHGFGASTRAIARAAGVSEALLFQRHGTKVDLFFAAMVPPPFVPPAPAQGARSLEQDLGTLALEVLAYFREVMPILVQLVTHPDFQVEELARRAGSSPLGGLHEVVLARLQAWRRTGGVKASPRAVRAAAFGLVASLHSVALLERMGVHGGAVPDRVITELCSVLAAGLAAKKGRTP